MPRYDDEIYDGDYRDEEYVRYYDVIHPETTIVFKGKINFTAKHENCLKDIVEAAIQNSINGIAEIYDEDIKDATFESGFTETGDGIDSYFSYSCSIKVYTDETYIVNSYDEWHSEVHAAEHFVEIEEANEAHFDKGTYEKEIRNNIQKDSAKGKLPSNLEILDIDLPYIDIKWNDTENY